jgi:dephospho-CoA kinase
MLKLAITGGVACGKSTAGRYLAGEGVAVRDADELAHGLMRRGTPVYEQVVAAFGTGVLAADGSIDRRRLGRCVFADARARERLNRLTHPAVREAWECWLSGCGSEVESAAVIIPLLYEGGFEHGWDAVICLAAPRATQRRRLCERGLSPEEADLLIDAQMHVDVKMCLADYVVDGGGTVALLEEQLRRVWRRIKRGHHGRQE